MKVKFDAPIEISGVKTDHVDLREPIVRDILEMQKRTGSDAEKELFLFADLTQIPPDELKKMPLKAYRKIQEAFQSDFLS